MLPIPQPSMVLNAVDVPLKCRFRFINYHQQIRICKWFVLPSFVSWTNKRTRLITEDKRLVDISPVSSIHDKVSRNS